MADDGWEKRSALALESITKMLDIFLVQDPFDVVREVRQLLERLEYAEAHLRERTGGPLP